MSIVCAFLSVGLLRIHKNPQEFPSLPPRGCGFVPFWGVARGPSPTTNTNTNSNTNENTTTTTTSTTNANDTDWLARAEGMVEERGKLSQTEEFINLLVVALP